MKLPEDFSRKNLFIIVSLLIVILSLPLVVLLVQKQTQYRGKAAGNTYYVATNGDDSNPGTLEKPWRTIQKAADSVQAGDTIYVRAGTYKGEINWTKSGRSDAPITLTNFPGESFTISAESQPYGISLGRWHSQERKIEYVQFIGDPPGSFKIRDWGHRGSGEGEAGINILSHIGINHITIRGIELTGSRTGWAIVMESQGGYMDYNVIEDCIIHDLGTEDWGSRTYQGYGIVFWGDDGRNRHTIIRRNKIYRTARLAISIGPDTAYLPEVPNEDIEIYDNEIYDTGDNEYEGGIQIMNSKNIKVHHNKMNNIGRGIVISNSEFYIYNNLIVNSRQNGIQIYSWSEDKSNLFGNIYHNTVYNSQKYNIWVGTPANYHSEIKNNIFYAGGSGDIICSPDKNFEVSNNLAGQDPLFVNTQGGDFHLQANSPAIDTGTDVGVDEDFDGVSRPQGEGFDIGAYEYTSGVVPTVPSSPSPTSTPSPGEGPTPQLDHCLPWGDIDCSCEVNALDYSYLLAHYNTADAKADLNDSDRVDALDVSLLLNNFGKECTEISPTPTPRLTPGPTPTQSPSPSPGGPIPTPRPPVSGETLYGLAFLRYGNDPNLHYLKELGLNSCLVSGGSITSDFEGNLGPLAEAGCKLIVIWGPEARRQFFFNDPLTETERAYLSGLEKWCLSQDDVDACAPVFVHEPKNPEHGGVRTPEEQQAEYRRLKDEFPNLEFFNFIQIGLEDYLMEDMCDICDIFLYPFGFDWGGIDRTIDQYQKDKAVADTVVNSNGQTVRLSLIAQPMGIGGPLPEVEEWRELACKTLALKPYNVWIGAIGTGYADDNIDHEDYRRVIKEMTSGTGCEGY